MTLTSFRRLPALILVLIFMIQASGAVLSAPVSQDTSPPIILSSCESPRSNTGVSVNYNADIVLDSELLQSLLQQATSYVRRGTTAATNGDYAQARRFYTYAVDYLNYLYNIYNGRAFSNVTAGNTADAISDYLRAFSLSVNLADVYDRRGQANAALQDATAASRDIESALTMMPQLRVNGLYAPVYYQLGNEALADYQYNRAIDAYDRAIELDPGYFEAYHKRGGVYLLLDDYAFAAEDFSCSIELQPDYVANYQLRGRALAGAGQYEAAIEDFSLALSRNPRLALARIDRGLAYQETGDLVQAITDFTWAILINPQQAETYNLRGNAYGQVGLYDEAIKDYDRAILLAPNEAGFYANRAWAQLQLNNSPAAAASFAGFLSRANYTVPVTLITLLERWLPDGTGASSSAPIDVGEARG